MSYIKVNSFIILREFAKSANNLGCIGQITIQYTYRKNTQQKTSLPKQGMRLRMMICILSHLK